MAPNFSSAILLLMAVGPFTVTSLKLTGGGVQVMEFKKIPLQASTTLHPSDEPGALMDFHPTQAIAYLAFGDYASSSVFGASLETLGRNGKWSGPVVVLTDQVQCLTQHQAPRARKAGVNLTIVSVPLADMDGEEKNMEIKQLKTRLYEVLASAGFSGLKQIIYMDADILVGAPLERLELEVAKTRRAHPEAGVLLFPENKVGRTAAGLARGEKFHGGFFVVENTTLARSCMQEWGVQIFKESSLGHSRDQTALMKTTCEKRGVIATMSTDGLMQWPSEESMTAGLRDTFIHMTNYRMSKQGWQPAVQSFWSKTLRLEGNPWDSPSCA